MILCLHLVEARIGRAYFTGTASGNTGTTSQEAGAMKAGNLKGRPGYYYTKCKIFKAGATGIIMVMKAQ